MNTGSQIIQDEHYDTLLSCMLFKGMTTHEIQAILPCLGGNIRSYDKDTYMVSEEDHLEEVGILLKGSANIIKEDYWGNRAIIAKLIPGDMFGETLACLNLEKLDISVVANEKVEVLFINYKKIIHNCSAACKFHLQLIENMLLILAYKNRILTNKIDHIVKKTIREKLLSYLSQMAKEAGKDSFLIPFNRQELADYLSVDRSAMSNELSKLRDEGVLEFKKNAFTLRKE